MGALARSGESRPMAFRHVGPWSCRRHHAASTPPPVSRCARNTAYHAVKDRATIARSVTTHGPAPLGPDAPPTERLVAFVGAYLAYAYRHLDLIRMSEAKAPGTRYRIGAYRFWHRACGVP